MPCTLTGYPGVAATNATGKQLGDAAGWNPLYPARLVTIPAGGTAHADLFWSDGEVFTSGCKPTQASLLKVYPPNSHDGKGRLLRPAGLHARQPPLPVRHRHPLRAKARRLS